MIVKLNDPEFWSQFDQKDPEEETDVSLLPKDTYLAPYKEPLSYGEEVSRGAARGTDQLQALGYGTVGLLGDIVGSDAVKDFGLEGYERNMEEAAQNMGTVAGFTDIEDPDDFVRWSIGTLAEFSPQLLMSIASGGLGAQIGRKAVSGAVKEFVERKAAEKVAGGMAADLARKAAQLEAAQQITSRAMKTGIGAAGSATGIGQMTGSIYGDTQDPWLAVKYGVPAGAIEGIYDRVIGGKLVDIGFGQQGKRGLVKGALGTGALGGVIEGPGEEVPQTYLEQMAKAEADPTYDITSPEARKQLIDAGAAGALAGGGVAGTTGAISELAPLTQRALRDRELPSLERTLLGEKESEPQPTPPAMPAVEYLDAESTPIVDDRLGSLQVRRFRLKGDDKVWLSVSNPSEDLKQVSFNLKPYTGLDEWMILTGGATGSALEHLAVNGGRKAGAPGTQKWETVSKFTAFQGVTDPLSKTEQRISAMVEDPNADVIQDLNIGKFDPSFDPTTEPRPLADAAADKDEFVLDGVRGYLAKDETGKTVFKSFEDGQEIVLPKNVEDAVQDDSFDANELSSLLDEDTAERFQYSKKPVNIKGTQRIQKAIDAVSAFEGATDEAQKLAALQSLSAADLAAAKDQIARGELAAEQTPDGSAKTRELGFYAKLKNSLVPFEQAKAEAVSAGTIEEEKAAPPTQGEFSDLSKGPPIQLTEEEAKYIGWNQDERVFEIRQDFATNIAGDDTAGKFLQGLQELVDQKNARIGRKPDKAPLLSGISQQIEQSAKLTADLTALEQLQAETVYPQNSTTKSAENYFEAQLPKRSKQITASKEFEQALEKFNQAPEENREAEKQNLEKAREKLISATEEITGKKFTPEEKAKFDPKTDLGSSTLPSQPVSETLEISLLESKAKFIAGLRKNISDDTDPLVKLLKGQTPDIGAQLETAENIFRASATELQNKPLRADKSESTNARDLLPQAEAVLKKVNAVLPASKKAKAASEAESSATQDTFKSEKERIQQRMRELGGPLVRVIYNDPRTGRKLYGALVADERGQARDQQGKFRFRPYGSTFAGDADLQLSPEAVSANVEMDALGAMEENLKGYIGDRADTKNTSLLENMLIAGRLLQAERRAKEANAEDAIQNRSDDQVNEEINSYAAGEKITFVLPGEGQSIISQDYVAEDGTIYRPLNVGEFKGKTAATNARMQPNAEGKMVPVPMGTKDEIELGALKGMKDREAFRAQVATELGIPPDKVTEEEIRKRVINVERPIYDQGFNAGRSGNRALPPSQRSGVWMLGYVAGRNELEKNTSWVEQDIKKLEKRVDDTRNDGILFDRFYIKIGNPNEKPPKAGKARQMPKQVGILDQLIKGSEIGVYAEGREGEVILKSNWNNVSRLPKKESYFTVQEKDDQQPFINQFESIGSGTVGSSRRIMTGQGSLQVLVQDAELTEEEQVITAVLQQTGIKTAPQNEIYSRLAELGFKVAPLNKPAIFDLGAEKLVEQGSFGFVDDIYGIKVPVTVGLFSSNQNPGSVTTKGDGTLRTSGAFFAKTHVQLDGAFEPLKKAFEAARRYERAKAKKGQTAAAGLKDAAIDKLKAEQDLRRAVLAAMDKGYDVRVRAGETTEEGKKAIGAEFEEYLSDLGITVSPDRNHFLVTAVSYNPTPQGNVENYSVRSDKSAQLFQRSVRRPGQTQQDAAGTLSAAVIQKGRAASTNTRRGLGVAERILTNWTAKNLEIQQRRKELNRVQAGRGKGAAARAAAQTRGFNAFGERLYGILFDRARRHIENAPADDEVKTLWLDEVKALIGKQIRVAQRSMLTDSLRDKLQTRLNKIEARWDLIKPEKGFVKSRKTETWGQSTPDPTQTQAGYRRSFQLWQDQKEEALAAEETDYLREILPRLKGARVGVIETRAYDSALKAVKEEMIAAEMKKPRTPTVEEIETALAQDAEIVKLRERLNAAGISKTKANDLRKKIDARSKKVISAFKKTTTTPRKNAEATVEELLSQAELPIQWRNRVSETKGYKELFEYLGLVKLQGENQWGLDKTGESYSVANEADLGVIYRTLEFAQNQMFRFTPEQEKIASTLEAIFQGRLEEVQTQYGAKTLELLDKYKKAGKDKVKVKKFRGSRRDKEEVVLGKGESEKLSDEAVSALEAENFARIMEFGLDQLTPGQQREVQEILDQYGEKEANLARVRFLQENEQSLEGEVYSKAERDKMQKDAEKALRDDEDSMTGFFPEAFAEEVLMALIADANTKIAAENKKSTTAAEKKAKLSEVDKGVLEAYAKALEAVYSTNLFGRRQGTKAPPGLVWQAGSRASRTVKALREQNESLDSPAGQMPLQPDPTWGGTDRVGVSEKIDDLIYDSILSWLKIESGRQGRPGQEVAAGVLIPEDIRKQADAAFNKIKQLVNITEEEQAEIDRLWDQNLTKDSQALENRLVDEKAEKLRDLMFFMGARSGGTSAQRRNGRELMRQVIPSFEAVSAADEVNEYSLKLMQRKGVIVTTAKEWTPSEYGLDLMRRKGIASTAVPKQPNTAESNTIATPQPGNIPVDAAQSKAARARFVQNYGMLSDAEMLNLTDEEIDKAYAAASSKASAEGAAMALDSVLQATPSMETLLSMSEEDLIKAYIAEEKAAQREGGRFNPVEKALTGKTGQGAAAEQQLNFSTLLKNRAFGNYDTFLRHISNISNSASIPRAQRLIAKQYLDAQKGGFKWRDVAMQIAAFATRNNKKASWAGLMGRSVDSPGGMAVYINTDAPHDGGVIQTMLHEADHILTFANAYAEEFGITLNETQAAARERLIQKWNEATLKAGDKLVADGVIDGKQMSSMSAEQKRDFIISEIQNLATRDGKFRAYAGVTTLAEFITEAKVSGEFRSLLADLGFNAPRKGEQKFQLGAWIKDLFRSVAELVTGKRIDPSSELAQIYEDSWELAKNRNFAVQPTQLARSLGIDSANLGETKTSTPATGNPEGVTLKSGTKNYQLDLVEEKGKYIVRAQWGGDGRKMQSKDLTPPRTYKEAKIFFDKKLAEKTGKGYKRVDQPPPEGPKSLAKAPQISSRMMGIISRNGDDVQIKKHSFKSHRDLFGSKVNSYDRFYVQNGVVFWYAEPSLDSRFAVEDAVAKKGGEVKRHSLVVAMDAAIHRINPFDGEYWNYHLLKESEMDELAKIFKESDRVTESMREKAEKIFKKAKSEGRDVREGRDQPGWGEWEPTKKINRRPVMSLAAQPTAPQSSSGGRWLSDDEYRRQRAVDYLRRRYEGSWDYLTYSEKEKEIQDLLRRDSNTGYYRSADYPTRSLARVASAALDGVNTVVSNIDEAIAKLQIPDIKDPNKLERMASSFSSRSFLELGRSADRLREEANLAKRELFRLGSIFNLFSFKERKIAEERFNILSRKSQELDWEFMQRYGGEFEKRVFTTSLEIKKEAEESIKKVKDALEEMARLNEAVEIFTRPDEFTPPYSLATSPDRGAVARLISGGAKEETTVTGDRVRFGGWFDSERGAPQEVADFYAKSVAERKAAERKIESLATILSKRLKGAQDIPLGTVQTALGSIENPLTPEQASEIRELEMDGMQQEADELQTEYRAQNRESFRRRQQEAMNQLPENIAEIVGDMRWHLDDLGQQIKKSEGIDGGVAVTIDENKGIYLNRSYLVFQDAVTAEKHRKAVRNNPRLMADAADFVRRRLVEEKADAEVRRAYRKDGVLIFREDVVPNISVTNDEIARGIERLLNVNEQGFGRIIMSGRIPGQKTGETLRIFDQRGNIDEVIQKLWGVINDPVTNYVNTALKMAAFLANDGFLADLRDAGTQNGLLYDPMNPATLSEEDREKYDAALEAAREENPNLMIETRFNKPKFRAALAKQNPELLSIFEEAERNVPQGYVKLSGESNKSLAPVSGMYAQADLAKWMFEKYPPGGSQAQESWVKVLGTLTMLPMAMKTVGSVVGQVRNLVSGGLFLVAGDNANFMDPEWRKSSIEGLRMTFGDAWFGLDNAKNRKELQARIEELGRLGVINQSVGANLTNDILRLRRAALIPDADESGKAMIQVLGQRALKSGAKLRDFFIDSYGASDDLVKIITYTSELGKYRRAMPNMPVEQLKEKVAKIARDIHPTYSETYAFTKGLKRQPFIAPFISFTSEIIRTSINLVRLSNAEIREGRETGNDELVKIGWGRRKGMAAAALAPTLLSAAVGAVAGVNGEDEEDLRRFLPTWQKHNQLLMFGKSNGKFQFLDISFSDPYAVLKTPFVAASNAIFNNDEATAGERIKDMTVGFLGELLAPWSGEQLFIGSIMDLARNKDAAGREIVNWQDSGANIAAGVTEHIWKTFSPGTLDTFDRIGKAMFGVVSDTGRSYDLGPELLAFSGTRPRETDIRQAIGFKANQFMRDYRDASSIFTGELLTRGTRSPGDTTDAFNRASESTGRLVRDFRELVKAAQRQGIKKEELRSILKAANISDEMIDSVFTGKFKYKPSKQALTRAEEMGNRARVRETQAAMR